MDTTKARIIARVRRKGAGAVVTPKDFLDLAGRDAVDLALSRLVRQHTLHLAPLRLGNRVLSRVYRVAGLVGQVHFLDHQRLLTAPPPQFVYDPVVADAKQPRRYFSSLRSEAREL